ncbi:KdsC family phosphatase [Castellaniella defragrans]|uniref:3-deoxy-D-manno-octulosonate 8-phosphate phosphatase KdsC n=1 Tax=Castellaniella defragrans TaxID=75697 RepID=A0A7W9WLL6_CASDE|nr:HAD hydrolase family protein [Castellaniella defragrans]KAB0620071.1 HAD hydrolase family protein [Castellaniella defragrans]MBB6083392.1 3-deoxy-D-manno-octulosonate 8-phosphate phosphatase (KDO 8-P phosphatase) [Castellaniella defragrans]
MNEQPGFSHPAEAQILARVPETVRNRARAVRLMVFDVDGILTDGSLWYGEHGEAVKPFNALDGHGLRLLREQGIRVAWVSGRKSAITARRAAELGISPALQGVRDKITTVEELAREAGLSLQAVGYMGDDIIDLPVLQCVGFAASVPNAPFYVGQAAHWTSTLRGGAGAVRECCDLILAAQGRLGACFTASLSTLGGAIQ